MGFLDTCSIKIKSIWAKITYPYPIAPKSKYKNFFDLDTLHSQDNIKIVRRSEKTEQESFDEFNTLREDALVGSKRKIVGLSMNILGSLFSYLHIKFNLKSRAIETWNKDKDSFIILKYLWYIEKVEGDNCPIYFSLNDIHKMVFPYYQKKEDGKKLQKCLKGLSEEEIKKVKEDNLKECNGYSVVLHKPNKLNYWHIEFHICDSDGNFVEEKRFNSKISSGIGLKEANSTTQLIQSATDWLLKCAKKDVDFNSLGKIPESVYI
jgi:hypothetical protein